MAVNSSLSAWLRWEITWSLPRMNAASFDPPPLTRRRHKRASSPCARAAIVAHDAQNPQSKIPRAIESQSRSRKVRLQAHTTWSPASAGLDDKVFDPDPCFDASPVLQNHAIQPKVRAFVVRRIRLPRLDRRCCQVDVRDETFVEQRGCGAASTDRRHHFDSAL